MKPDSKHSQYLATQNAWQRCRDFVAGSDQVKQMGTAYLPRLAGQDPSTPEGKAAYEAMKARTVFYNGTARTVEGLSGLVMRIDPVFELPPSLAELEDDVDYMGTGLFEFAGNLVDENLTVARAGILVDMPASAEDILTQAQQESVGLRPYLVTYAAEDILDWWTVRSNGRTQLTHVRLMEQYSTDTEDEFVKSTADQIRVLDLDPEGNYRQRIFRRDGKEWGQWGDDIFPLRGGQKLREIPFFFLGGGHNNADVQKPPLLDLVNVNLGHYQVASSYYHALHFTGCPTPVITGHKVPENEVIAIGSETFLVLSSQGASAFFLEYEGKGIDQVEKELGNLERRMALLGARMLMEEKKGVEAAETAAINRGGESGVLSAIAGATAKAIRRALEFAAEWAGGDPSQVAFDLNRDFLPAQMDSGMLRELTQAWQSGGISHQVYFEALQRGEIIRGETDFEGMKEDIENDLPAAPAPAPAPGGSPFPAEPAQLEE